MTSPARATAEYEPFNIEAEKAQLSAMLREPECIESAVSIAGPAEFSKSHAPICSCILEQFQAGESPDLITVIDALRSKGELENVGGPVYVSSLLDMGAIGKNARAYAELVRTAADIRKARESIKTALQKATNRNGRDPYDSIRNLISELGKIVEPKLQESISWPLWDASEMPSWPVDPPAWTVKDLIPKGGIGFMSAAPKSLKSMSALDLSLHLAQKQALRNWFDRYQVRPSRVLFVAREDPGYRIQERAAEICKGYQLPYPEPGRLQFLIRERLSLTDAVHRGWLKRQITANKFDFLVLDVLNRMIPDLDELSAKDMACMVSILEDLNRDLGITILCLDHTRKPQGKNLGRDTQEPNPFDLKGSVAKYGCADFMICLARTPEEGRIQIYCENKDTDEHPHFFVNVSPKGSGKPKFTWSGDVEKLASDMKAIGDANRQKVLEVLSNGEWKSRKDISEELKMSSSTVGKHISALLKAGKVEPQGKGPSSRYRIIIDRSEKGFYPEANNLFKNND